MIAGMKAKPSVQLFKRALLAITAAFLPFSAMAEPERFVVYYGQDAGAEALLGYDLAVLDADHHPPLAPLKARGMRLFGYVSVGESDKARSYGNEVAVSGVLLGPNPNWPGSNYVDLRKPAWHRLLLDRIIPAIVAQGFDGLFLDTLDDAAFLERADPVRNHGMVEAGAQIIREIRARYPTLPLMLNRAFDIGELVAGDLDSVLAESLASDYDFKTKRYGLRSKSDLKWGLDRLAKLRAINPSLRIYTLDYADPNDKPIIGRLYQQQRRAGFIPYVATIDLQHIIPEASPTQFGGRK